MNIQQLQAHKAYKRCILVKTILREMDVCPHISAAGFFYARDKFSRISDLLFLQMSLHKHTNSTKSV